MPKSGADDDIVTACRAAMRGEPFLYPSAMHALIRDVITRADQRNEELELLTPRELEILELIAEGHSSKEIAAVLVLSIKTVETIAPIAGIPRLGASGGRYVARIMSPRLLPADWQALHLRPHGRQRVGLMGV